MMSALARRLEGRRIVLEPLEPGHEEGLWTAAQDQRIWRWMSVRAAESREAFHSWFEEALTARRAGREVPFATLDAASAKPIGSTRYLAVRPEHRVVEIGWTWIAPSQWSSGANVEAKYLMLRHAFELGFLRVEFKTDALNQRARGALAALPAEFEGVHRRHMLVRGGERRDSAWYAVIDEDWPAVRSALESRLSRSAGLM
jgi:RimJ/RimL family protein N-acetyltransferase